MSIITMQSYLQNKRKIYERDLERSKNNNTIYIYREREKSERRRKCQEHYHLNIHEE